MPSVCSEMRVTVSDESVKSVLWPVLLNDTVDCSAACLSHAPCEA